MKRFTDFLRVLGFGFLLVLSTAVLDSNANGGCSPKSPLRGTWGWYQLRFFIPSGSSTPLAGTEAGNMRVDECGDIMGHAFFNFLPNETGEADFSGTCETPEDGLFKCTIGTQIRACAASARKGGCFDEFYCVIGDATVEPQKALITEFKRQGPGTCN
jgi:hypothetical protein